jgi:ribosomal protein S18 acetylase RimI-like enzyme
MAVAIRIEHGLAADMIPAAAALLIEAFDAKFAHEMRPASPEQAQRVVVAGFVSDDAWVAVDADGSLLGLAGIAAAGRPFFRFPFAVLTREFGVFGALWRKAYALLEVLALPRRRLTRRLEVLAVREGARGRGVGTALLQAAVAGARDAGADRLQLEVVDTNGRAKQLYERVGFRATRTVHSGILTAGGGYRAVHFMRMDL